MAVTSPAPTRELPHPDLADVELPAVLFALSDPARLDLVRALDRKPVTLFSDLLLHDMGSLNDGIAQADALPTEMKTAPLWGLRHRAPYLHDGRAPTLSGAIDAHDGEGSVSRDRFNKLGAGQQKQLLDFLNNL